MKSLIVAGLAAAAGVAASEPAELDRRSTGAGMLESADSFLTPRVRLSVGTPPQTVYADLDVGTGDTVVGGSPFAGGAFYAPASSSLKQGDKITHTVPSTLNVSTQGTVATDVLRLGDWSQEASFGGSSTKRRAC